MVIGTVALEKMLRAEFNRTMDQFVASDVYSRLFATVGDVVPSRSSQEKYGLLGDVPVVKELIGDKTIGSLTDYSYTLVNKDYYTGIAVHKNELADDQMGIILPRIRTMVSRIQSHRGKLVANLIINGTTGTAYDGNAFFADRTAPNDNLLAGTGTTLAQIQADIYSARAAMLKFQSDTGEVLGIEGDVIVCPPELEGKMLEAVMSTQGLTASGTAAMTQNPISRWIRGVVVLPNATDANDWYMLATGFALRPFFWQDRERPEPVLDDTQVKRNKKYEYSVDFRGAAGYGLFQTAVKVVNS